MWLAKVTQTLPGVPKKNFPGMGYPGLSTGIKLKFTHKKRTTMKKALAILAMAGLMTACNNGSSADASKDSTNKMIDSSAKAAKDSVAVNADSTKKMIDSSAKAAKDSVK